MWKRVNLIIVFFVAVLIVAIGFSAYVENVRYSPSDVGLESDCVEGIVSKECPPSYYDPSLLCDLPGDQGNLYSTQTSLFIQDGMPSFRTIRADGLVLRESFPGELFYDGNPSLNVTYTILPKCGGVDIFYNIHNPTVTPKSFPDLRIEGIVQNEKNVDFLYDNGYGGMVQLIDDKGDLNTPFYDKFTSGRYPGPQIYSPVIVMRDSDFSVGSSLQYPYLDYKHAVYMDLVRDSSNGLWTQRYHSFRNENGGLARIQPGEVKQYTVSLRYAPDTKWIYTLQPYKEFFQNNYESDITPKNLNPVRAYTLAGGSVNSGNPRGYKEDFRIDLFGWGPILQNIIDSSRDKGFTRLFFWAPSGFYINYADNFAPQFASDWLPMVESTAWDLSLIEQNNMTFGFVWGRAGKKPEPIQWNPPELVELDIRNVSHWNFVKNEYRVASGRGVHAIQFDTWQSIPAYDRYLIIAELKRIDPDIQLIHQGTGADFLHAQIANMYWPENNFPSSDYELIGPDVLSWYLNPNAEIQVYLRDNSQPDLDYIQDLIRWGYTPLISNGISIDLSDLDIEAEDLFF